MLGSGRCLNSSHLGTHGAHTNLLEAGATVSLLLEMAPEETDKQLPKRWNQDSNTANLAF